MKEMIRIAQAELNKRGLNAGPIDGIIGSKTIQALDSTGAIHIDWSTKRKL